MPLIFIKNLSKDLLRKKWIAIAVIFSIFILVFVYLGFWPVAVVDGGYITAREFNKNYNLGVRIYKNELKTYGEDEKKAGTAEVQNEIGRAVLEKIIENKIILDELEKTIGGKEASRKVSEKINSQNFNKEEVIKGIEIAYGLKVDEFKEIVLVPQARKEILEGNMFIADPSDDFEKWYGEKSKQVKVLILLPGLAWENGTVKIASGK